MSCGTEARTTNKCPWPDQPKETKETKREEFLFSILSFLSALLVVASCGVRTPQCGRQVPGFLKNGLVVLRKRGCETEDFSLTKIQMA
jgi:hypothetical protein